MWILVDRQHAQLHLPRPIFSSLISQTGLAGAGYHRPADRRGTLGGRDKLRRPVTASLQNPHLPRAGPDHPRQHRTSDSGCTGGVSRSSRDCRDTIWGGIAYNYALVASGRVDIVVGGGPQAADLSPRWCPVVGARAGTVCDWAATAHHRKAMARSSPSATRQKLDDVLEKRERGA